MKNAAIVFLCWLLTGCMAIRRHPVISGVVVGAAVGITVALVTRQHCDHYEPGYSGVGVNCPKPDATPGK